jgi:hypothetical protein
VSLSPSRRTKSFESRSSSFVSFCAFTLLYIVLNSSLLWPTTRLSFLQFPSFHSFIYYTFIICTFFDVYNVIFCLSVSCSIE